MKLVSIRKKIIFPLFIAICGLSISCSNDDKILDTINDNYLNIPDTIFETELIQQGIDSDGVINQQMLKEDAKKVHTLILEPNAINNSISDLTGIEGFTNLKKLIATQHTIEDIDLSYNTKLDTLYLGGNYITTIDLTHNTDLILVDIQSNQLTSISGISEIKSLKNLDLSWNYLEEFSIHNESIEVLHIRNNDLNSINLNGAVNLKNILLTTNQLTSIDLSTNPLIETLLIPDNRIENINLEYNGNLTHLYIFNNSLTSLDVSNNRELYDLKVDRNPYLNCIKVNDNQNIPIIAKSDYQKFNSTCN